MSTPFSVSKPPKLSQQPVIRIVHPSGTGGGHIDAIATGAMALEKAGCEVRWSMERANQNWRGYLAGDDAARCDEFCEALEMISYMGGGPSISYSAKALEAFDQFSA